MASDTTAGSPPLTLTDDLLDAIYSGLRAAMDALRRGFSPNPRRLVSEWAGEKRVLDNKSSKEPGLWSNDRTPYLREIMDAMSPYMPTIRGSIMKGAQVGGSEFALNIIGAAIDDTPCPIIVIHPTGALGERWSKLRLAPMLALCDDLAAKVPAKADGNTLTVKEFPGGVLVIASANSAADARSMAACIMIFEEPDEYPRDLDEQGSVIELVCARGATFSYRKKELFNCTPTLATDSIIYQEFMAGTQEEYQMPCPHSDPADPHYTVWTKEHFRNVRNQPDTAHFECRVCAKPIYEGLHKSKMLSTGRWVALNPDAGPAKRSWHIPSSMSPEGWLSWTEIADKTDRAHGNYARLKTLENTVWGLPWRDSTDTPEPQALIARARSSPYRMREIPDWVVMLTAGVDLGIDHMEIGVWGWGREGRRHHVEQIRLRGRPNDPTLWDRLESALTRVYEHPFGVYLPLRHVCIDRGYANDLVDPWVKGQDPDFISAVKGTDSTDFIAKDARKYNRDVYGKTVIGSVDIRYQIVGSDLCKLELYNALNLPWDPLKPHPARWITFSNDVEDDWFEQLVGEEYKVKVNQWGRAKGKWAKKNLAQRVEAMDCANYARVAALLEGYDSWLERDFDREFENLHKEARKLATMLDNEERRRRERGDMRPMSEDFPVKNIVRPGEDANAGYFGVPALMDQLVVEKMEAEAAKPAPVVEEAADPEPQGTPYMPGMTGSFGSRVGDKPVERQRGDGVVSKSGWGGIILPTVEGGGLDDDY